MYRTLSFPKNTLLILALLIVVWAVWPLVATALEDLPLTDHAKTSHASQTWNAATIQEHMKKRACTPHEYMCADKDQEIAYCEIKPGLAIGLIAGRTVRRIITGFAGPTNFWESRCK
jgi:hypothetical protein